MRTRPSRLGAPHRMVLQYHPRFGQWYVPNLRAYVPHERGYFTVRTNRDGMRSSRDYAHQASPGTFRVLLFGDSYTAGYGVHNEERFSDRLERLLGDVEVLNFGVDGSGIDQQVLIFEDMEQVFGGDLILLCPSVEDIRRVMLSHWPERDRHTGRVLLIPKPHGSFREGQLQLHHIPVPMERPDLSELSDAMRQPFAWMLGGSAGPRSLRHVIGRLLGPLKPSVLKWSGYQPFPQYASAQTPAWQLTVAFLERLVQRAGGRPVVLAPLPCCHHIQRISRPTYRDRFLEFAQGHRAVRFADLLPAFQALPSRQRRACRYRQDTHYTPLAHAVIARALADILVECRRQQDEAPHEPVAVVT